MGMKRQDLKNKRRKRKDMTKKRKKEKRSIEGGVKIWLENRILGLERDLLVCRCGQQSNHKLVANGYPDLGWDPVEGERFLDFLRFCVWVNGELLEVWDLKNVFQLSFH